MTCLFPDRRFGLFIHWGIYAAGGWHEQEQGRLQIPRLDYGRYMQRFDPTEFDADAWVHAAADAGMRYICFTAKHHDGFCMWDTDETDYKITRTPWGRDPLRELADACARADMALCVYYSIPDWHHPAACNPLSSHQITPEPGDTPDMAAYIDYVRAQITELLTRYGPIRALFWDIAPHIWDPGLNELARRLQPGFKINDRGFSEGDYATPERLVPSQRVFSRPTEACQSVGAQSWGHRVHQHYYSTAFLTRSIDTILAMGGSYLLNVGPDEKGSFGADGDRLRRVGDWYNRVRESYGEPVVDISLPDGVLATRQGENLYLHFRDGLNSSGVDLPGLPAPKAAVFLNDGRALPFAVEPLPALNCPWGTGFGGRRREGLHLWGIPVDDFAAEAAVVKLVY